jgi:hypothetical protein
MIVFCNMLYHIVYNSNRLMTADLLRVKTRAGLCKHSSRCLIMIRLIDQKSIHPSILSEPKSSIGRIVHKVYRLMLLRTLRCKSLILTCDEAEFLDSILHDISTYTPAFMNVRRAASTAKCSMKR